MRKDKASELREACIQEALVIIATAGVEGLSLREVARRLGVSHQAPYKHFPSRDHILAEIVRRTFDAFAQYLDQRPLTGDPHMDLRTMGQAYFEYAASHPLEYRLMFGTPLPDAAEHPHMMHSAQHAFRLLRDCIARMKTASNTTDLDALFVWSTIHGLASILQTHALDTLALPPETLNAVIQHTLKNIGAALANPEDML